MPLHVDPRKHELLEARILGDNALLSPTTFDPNEEPVFASSQQLSDGDAGGGGGSGVQREGASSSDSLGHDHEANNSSTTTTSGSDSIKTLTTSVTSASAYPALPSSSARLTYSVDGETHNMMGSTGNSLLRFSPTKASRQVRPFSV